jgi:hypothetical protein
MLSLGMSGALPQLVVLAQTVFSVTYSCSTCAVLLVFRDSSQQLCVQHRCCCCCCCRVYAAIACLFQDVCVRFLEERTDRALARCRQDEAGA